MITKDQQKQVMIAAMEREPMYGSAAKYSQYLGVNAAVWSRLKKGFNEGDMDGLVSPGKWISLARKLNVNISNKRDWKTANTPIFQFITGQLEMCQRDGLSSMLCDMSDIGKTHTALVYAATHKNVAYVDCSQAKTKQQLVRAIANAFGIGSNGSYSDLYADLVEYVKAIELPLIILDEAGDLSHSAFMEVKALWNATSEYCGFYMMGADGLEALMKRSIKHKRVGYTELFSRFGKRYGSIFRADNYTSDRELQARMTDKAHILEESAAMIIKANAKASANVNNVLRKTVGDDRHPSLRRIKTELCKN